MTTLAVPDLPAPALLGAESTKHRAMGGVTRELPRQLQYGDRSGSFRSSEIFFEGKKLHDFAAIVLAAPVREH